MADDILTRFEDHVLTVTLDRPAKRNALTTPMIASLQTAFARAATDETVRVLLVTGAGPAFCAGLDLRELAAQREAGAVETHTL